MDARAKLDDLRRRPKSTPITAMVVRVGCVGEVDAAPLPQSRACGRRAVITPREITSGGRVQLQASSAAPDAASLPALGPAAAGPFARTSFDARSARIPGLRSAAEGAQGNRGEAVADEVV